MKSKGGKVEYLCPNCYSPNIARDYKFGNQISGTCNNCNTFWPWVNRIKIGKNSIMPIVLSKKFIETKRVLDKVIDIMEIYKFGLVIVLLIILIILFKLN